MSTSVDIKSARRRQCRACGKHKPPSAFHNGDHICTLCAALKHHMRAHPTARPELVPFIHAFGDYDVQLRDAIGSKWWLTMERRLRREGALR